MLKGLSKSTENTQNHTKSHTKMARQPTVTSLEPSIENCDPLVVHRRATPGQYALSERPVLYGGGRKWTLRCSDPSSLQLFPLNHAEKIEVDVFVLTSGLVLWFPCCSQGVDVPYSCLGASALRNDTETRRMMLYLQVSATGALESDCYAQDTDYDASVEFELLPMGPESGRHVERLFTTEYFGSNKGDKMVVSTYNAITQCSSMCVSDEDEYDSGKDEEEDDKIWMSDSHYEYGYENGGDADDMDMNSSFEDGGNSGVDVVFYDEYGRRRTRDDMESQSPRDVKRVRC